jgi:hypothetical protein
MTTAGKRMIKAARAAVAFSRLLSRFEMVATPGATTVFVTKKGKVIGTVYGQRFVAPQQAGDGK